MGRVRNLHNFVCLCLSGNGVTIQLFEWFAVNKDMEAMEAMEAVMHRFVCISVEYITIYCSLYCVQSLGIVSIPWIPSA